MFRKSALAVVFSPFSYVSLVASMAYSSSSSTAVLVLRCKTHEVARVNVARVLLGALDAWFYSHVLVPETHFWVNCKDIGMRLLAPYIHVRQVHVIVHLLLLCPCIVHTVVPVPYPKCRVLFHRELESLPLPLIDGRHDSVRELVSAACPASPADAA
jgi:hypothetical protein